MPLAEVFDSVTGSRTGIEFRAYDASRAGPRDAPVRLDILSPGAVSYLVQARNDLGLARAYVSGGLEVHGDLHEALRRLWRVNEGNFGVRDRLRALMGVGLRALRPVDPPPEEARLHQVLGVRAEGGDAAMPLRPDWEPARATVAPGPEQVWSMPMQAPAATA